MPRNSGTVHFISVDNFFFNMGLGVTFFAPSMISVGRTIIILWPLFSIFFTRGDSEVNEESVETLCGAYWSPHASKRAISEFP